MKQLFLILIMSLGLVACAPGSRSSEDAFKSDEVGTYYLDSYARFTGSLSGGQGLQWTYAEGQRVIITEKFYRLETRINGEWILDAEGHGPRDMEMDFISHNIQQNNYFYGVRKINNVEYIFRYVKER